jgi:uncharacterized membrane protein
MAALALFVLALAAAGAAVLTALTPGGMTPDDELTLLFAILTCAVLLTGASIVNAVDRVRRAIEAAGRVP